VSSRISCFRSDSARRQKKIDAFLYRHRYEENDQANLALYCLASLIAVQECQDPNQMLGIVNPRKGSYFRMC
jgi:hypothetical protein